MCILPFFKLFCVLLKKTWREQFSTTAEMGGFTLMCYEWSQKKKKKCVIKLSFSHDWSVTDSQVFFTCHNKWRNIIAHALTLKINHSHHVKCLIILSVLYCTSKCQHGPQTYRILFIPVWDKASIWQPATWLTLSSFPKSRDFKQMLADSFSNTLNTCPRRPLRWGLGANVKGQGGKF